MPSKQDKETHIISMLQQLGMRDISKLELYQNVILAYDTDEDIRLREVVDRIDYFRKNLLLVHEQEGTLSLIWKKEIPSLYTVGNSIATTYPDGSLDHWFIGFSRLSEDIEKEHKEMYWLGGFVAN